MPTGANGEAPPKYYLTFIKIVLCWAEYAKEKKMIIESVWIKGLGEYRVGKGDSAFVHFVRAITEPRQLGRFTILEHNGAISMVCGGTFIVKHKPN